LKFRDLVKVIENDGWRFMRQKGSHAHHCSSSEAGRCDNSGKPSDDVPKGTLNNILKQAGLK
jgi:predicted RNA binding protein YcfA (HicA-like mRNA interferase family)